MGGKGREPAETGEIVGGELQQWSQLPNESAQAYAGFTAYADLPPGQRTIAAAYRALKGMPEDADVKPPGYFGAWAKKYRWRQRSAARDQIFKRIAVVAPVQKERQAADKRTVETANRLHDMIESELETLESMKDRKWKFGGDPVDKSAKLANLAAALESAARARLMALGGTESE